MLKAKKRSYIYFICATLWLALLTGTAHPNNLNAPCHNIPHPHENFSIPQHQSSKVHLITIVSPECLWCLAQLKELEKLKQTQPSFSITVLSEASNTKAMIRWRKAFSGSIYPISLEWKDLIAEISIRPFSLIINEHFCIRGSIKGFQDKTQIQELITTLFTEESPNEYKNQTDH
jgi:hypothetical protein